MSNLPRYLKVGGLTMGSRYIRRFVNVTLTGGKRKVSFPILYMDFYADTNGRFR